jgi:hypothetical protein
VVLGAVTAISAFAGGDVEKLAALCFNTIGTICGLTIGHRLGANGRDQSERRVNAAVKALHELGVSEEKLKEVLTA